MKKKLVTVSQSLSKTVKITVDSSDKGIALKNLFEREHWDIASLLEVLRSYVTQDMRNHISDRSAKQLEVILLATYGWTVDDYEVVEN